MLGVIGDRPDVLMARGKIDAVEPVGMRVRAGLPEFVPDRVGVRNPAGIKRIEIAGPIGDRDTLVHVRSPMSWISIASSGQLARARWAFSASSGPTRPSRRA